MNQRPVEPEPPLPELQSLARELPPPVDLESRLVGSLRAERLLREPRRSMWLQAAAAVLLIAGGIAIGRMTATRPAAPPATESRRFLFMLTDAAPAGDDRARAEQYRQWAADVRAGGRQISGERLANSGIAVVRNGSSPVMEPEVQGFFVISASGIDEAETIARSSPHVQSGGLIIVRPIDTP
jgi:hypothetical protein